MVLHEKLFYQLFSLESKFIHQIRKTWILIIIFVLFVIRHHKHALLIRIHDSDALELHEKLFFPLFSLELKFIHQMRETWVLVIRSILFVIGPHKKILLLRIYCINALVLHGKFFFLPFSL